MRDALTAEREFRNTIDLAVQNLGDAPDFALLFPCMGRGPHFYGNRDRDLDLIKHRFPACRFLMSGFYGNGEIAPLDGVNHLYQYSAVLGLYAVQGPGSGPEACSTARTGASCARFYFRAWRKHGAR